MRVLIWLAFSLAMAATAKQAGSALDEFQRIRGRLHDSRVANDWHANLVSAMEQKEFLHGAPNSLLEAARAEAKARNAKAALRELMEYARMGQSAELIATSADFATVRAEEGFAGLQSAMQANLARVSATATAFELSDAELMPEDIDFDAGVKRFLFSSVRGKRIVWVDPHGAMQEFAKAPDGWPVMALKIDGRRGVVWATEVALNGFTAVPKADWGRSAVLCFDGKTGALLRRIEGPRPSALGDMTLTRNGDVLVSDGDGGGVYRLLAKGKALERIDGGDFISPQTPAMAPDGYRVFVPDYLRGIGLLNLKTKQVQWLAADGKFALSGIDGLYLQGRTLIAVQNGSSPERVVAFRLDASLTKIESETILERSTATLGDPTHGVMVGEDFYYIANSGWDVVDDHGDPTPGAKVSVPRVMRAAVSFR